ncbi:DUF1697 domain-containing protein [soil metagenome]
MGLREDDVISERYVALLRGINVGGKNLVSMKELAAMFTEAGCSEVETYIQSGNVVFSADNAVVKGLAARISQEIEARFGCAVPVLLRSAVEMRMIVEGNPFLAKCVAVELLHVSFLANVPTDAMVAALDTARSPGDRFTVRGREVYLELGNGMGKTKLTNAYFDSKLKTVSTARNWRTVLKLLELVEKR